MGQHLSPRTSLIPTLAMKGLLGLLSTLGVLAWSRPAFAGEPVRLIVDTSKLAESDRERLRSSIHESVGDSIAEAGYEVVDDGAATTLRVRVEYLDAEDLEYAIYYDVQRDAVLADVPWVACVGCVDAKLLRTIGEGLPKALARVDELASAASEEGESESGEGGGTTGDPSEDPPPRPQVAKIGPLGIAGSIVAAGGLATLIAGAIELPKGEELGRLDGHTLEYLDHGKTGRVLLGTGASVLVVGVALLATDLALRSKQRSTKSARVPVPVLAPSFVGLALHGRF